MAKDTVDKAIQVGNLKPTGPCITHTLQVVGGKNWDRAFFTVITQVIFQEVSRYQPTPQGLQETEDIQTKRVRKGIGENSFYNSTASQQILWNKSSQSCTTGSGTIECSVNFQLGTFCC
jgi:hypothetical protein